MIGLLLDKRVLGVLAALVVLGGLAYGWHLTKEHYRDQGRAEVRLEFDSYKAKVQQAAADAKVAVDRLAEQNQVLAAKLSANATSRKTKLDQSAKEAQDVIQSTALPDCKLPDGVRDAINRARRGTASEIDSAYQSAGTVQAPAGGERQPREPRKQRGD